MSGKQHVTSRQLKPAISTRTLQIMTLLPPDPGESDWECDSEDNDDELHRLGDVSRSQLEVNISEDEEVLSSPVCSLSPGMLVALYRIELKSRRWYLQLFTEMIDIALNNAWLLRRRELKLKEISDTKIASLKDFRNAIFEDLTKRNRKGRQKKDMNTTKKVIKNPKATRPIKSVRYDLLGHFPTHTTIGRCKHCKDCQ